MLRHIVNVIFIEEYQERIQFKAQPRENQQWPNVSARLKRCLFHIYPLRWPLYYGRPLLRKRIVPLCGIVRTHKMEAANLQGPYPSLIRYPSVHVIIDVLPAHRVSVRFVYGEKSAING